ncbi:MAG: PilW family protein [Methylobacter sp.]
MKHAGAGRSQKGLTLIELMIAMLLGIFLIGGVLQIFLSSKQTYRMQENLSRLQENGRFTLDFLARDIRMTGYWGCLQKAAGDIVGSDNNAVNGDNIDNGTDTITLKGAFAATPPNVTCSSSVNTSAAYYTDLSSTVAYRVNSGVLQKITNNQTNDLIEGVENMQILYGADTDGDYTANYYVPEGTVGLNREQVVSLRFSLLVRSIDDNLTNQPLQYNYPLPTSTATTATDRRIRRVFTSTIAVRNRLP